MYRKNAYNSVLLSRFHFMETISGCQNHGLWPSIYPLNHRSIRSAAAAAVTAAFMRVWMSDDKPNFFVAVAPCCWVVLYMQRHCRVSLRA